MPNKHGVYVKEEKIAWEDSQGMASIKYAKVGKKYLAVIKKREAKTSFV